MAKKIRNLALALMAAVAAHAQTPVLDCAALNSQTSQITAYFGYTSNPDPSTTIPLGANNFVDATGMVAGAIPIAFTTGAQHVLFSVRFSSTLTVGWHLNGQAATANAQSVASTPCQLAVGQGLPSYAQLRCWDRNSNNTCDLSEDLDGDGFCTILDCGGPQGTTGTQGTTGAPGTTGPAGVHGTAPVFQSITASPGTANAAASCGSTKFLVTGGGMCTVPNIPGMGRIALSAASSDGNGWSVSCNAGQATAVAVCAPKQ